MNSGVIALAVPIVAIIMGTILTILLRYFTNVERMAMLEKGIPFPQKQSYNVNPASALRWGFLSLGAGVGLFIAILLGQTMPEINEDPLFFAMLLIFGGLGLLISYIFQLRLDEKFGKIKK